MLENVMYLSGRSDQEIDYESARNIFKQYETLRNRINTAQSSSKKENCAESSVESSSKIEENTFLKNLENLDKAFGEHHKRAGKMIDSHRRDMKGDIDVLQKVYMSNFMSFRDRENFDLREPGDPSLFKKRTCYTQENREEEIKRIIEEEKILSKKLFSVKNEKSQIPIGNFEDQNFRLNSQEMCYQGSNLHKIISKSGKINRLINRSSS